MIVFMISLFGNELWFNLTSSCVIGAVLLSISLNLPKKESKDIFPIHYLQGKVHIGSAVYILF